MENPQQEQDKGKEKLSPQGQVQLLEDIAMFLRHNVVQGKRVVANDTEQYHLNIHKDTELGDNDTVKTGKVDTKLRGREWKRGDTNTGCGNGGK